MKETLDLLAIEALAQSAPPLPRNGIIIEGGEGVGRITKTWLDAPVGEAAINRTPRRMIQEQAAAVYAQYGYVSLYQEETSWLNAPLTIGLSLWEGFLSLVQAA